jgi:hypothetical protein
VLGGSGFAVSKSEGWCRHQRTDQLQTMERLAGSLFAGTAETVKRSLNCGGSGEEYYPMPTVTVDMKRSVDVQQVETILRQKRWRGERSKMVAPDGDYQLDYSTMTSPAHPYPFVSVGIRPTGS